MYLKMCPLFSSDSIKSKNKINTKNIVLFKIFQFLIWNLSEIYYILFVAHSSDHGLFIIHTDFCWDNTSQFLYIYFLTYCFWLKFDYHNFIKSVFRFSILQHEISKSYGHKKWYKWIKWIYKNLLKMKCYVV